MTDLFLDAVKNIQDSSNSARRYGKLFALRDLLTEINTMKNNIDFLRLIKQKKLIEKY